MNSINKLNKNIIEWYPFSKDSSILYLTVDDDNEMIEYLANNCRNIKVVKFCDNSKVETEVIGNIEKITGNYRKISIEDKYDYVILLGTLEYANIIIKEKNSDIQLLNFSKSKLNKDGKILLAVDNKMGVKYISGNKSKHCEKIYDSIYNKFINGKMFSNSEIINVIDKCNFKYKKLYYPLPDYKFTSVIYSDELQPNYNDSKLNYNIVYNEESLVLMDEISLLKQFIKEGNFKEYANSYFIEISDSEILTDIKYVSFNNMRKDKYSMILKIHENKVEKCIENITAKEHLEKIKNNILKMKDIGFKLAEEELQEEENKIIEKIIKYPLLDDYIVSLIKQNKITAAFQIIDSWYNYIKKLLKEDNNGYIKDGFIDIVFENTFYNDEENEFIFFDQEWYDENIPLGFILYRSIHNLYSHNKDLNNYLPIEEFEKKFNICETEEYRQLEEKLQEEIIDNDKREFYAQQYKYLNSSEEIKKAIDSLKKFDKDNIELKEEIERLNNENKNLIEENKKNKKINIFDIIKNKLTDKKQLK